MKVVLVNPRSMNPEEIQQKCFAPLSLMYLASSLRKEGHEPHIIDANAWGLTDQDVARRAADEKPALIGVPLLSDIFIQTHHLIEHIKAACPEARIVAGGPHATALPRKVLDEFRDVDFVLSGESEKSLPALCAALDAHRDPSGVPGLSHRKDGEVRVTEPAPPVEDVDALPAPARDLLRREYDRKRYYIVLARQRPVETIVTSRGCPFQCRFCCNAHRRYRARSPESVLEEITERYSYEIRQFDFADANFTFDRDRAMAVFRGIKKEGLGISFRLKSRTDRIDEELVREARDAGAYLISLGMESGSQDILDRMNKRTDIGMNVKACETVMKAGLKLNTGWVIGFPGETPETVAETVDLIVNTRPTTANITILVPYPGTNVYEEAKAAGTLRGDWSVDQEAVPWVKLPWLKSYAHLEETLKKARNRVYYRPYYVFSFMKEILGNANLMLARYAFQELMKSL